MVCLRELGNDQLNRDCGHCGAVKVNILTVKVIIRTYGFPLVALCNLKKVATGNSVELTWLKVQFHLLPSSRREEGIDSEGIGFEFVSWHRTA